MMPSRSAATIASARVDRMASATASDMSTTAPADQIFTSTSKNRAFCGANTTSDNFFGSVRLAAPQLSQSFSTKPEGTQDPVPMHEWSGSQIPDMAAYIEWLAIVGSLKWQHSAILTWRPNLRVLRAGE